MAISSICLPVRSALHVGYERREEEGDFENSGFSQQGLGRQEAVLPISGSYVSKEIYAEFYGAVDLKRHGYSG